MKLTTFCAAGVALLLGGGADAATLLLDQDFETPNTPPGFSDTSGGGDVSQQTVNALYGGQPTGFLYAQSNTVETLSIGAGGAFVSGYLDPGGRAGSFLLGLLSSAQDDRLGLSFDVGDFDFLNVFIDVTSIDLDRLGGPFIPGAGVTTDAGTAPQFRFTLFDNPGAGVGIRSGAPLDSFVGTGTRSDRNVVDFRRLAFGLDASASTNGEVTLQIDLLSGGYAGFDNLRITADDIAATVPAPATLPLFVGSLAFIAFFRRRAPPSAAR